ncbi:LemA family protein [Methylibium rhizosphaerae]|uniref:LemA family protein n=1 Tax=Methylibium rhizosphaerae TaxID=2570323 RepID=UPI001127E3ED|nr:LemA family protein [Methylibium rhizosphaerae]
MTSTQIVTLVVLAVLGFWSVGAYNRLVRLRNAIANAFAQIDVQLKRRYDLIPNLVETARKYLEHERETLEAVTAARNQARAAADVARGRPSDAGAMKSLGVAEQVLTGAMGRLMALVEAYPELKADQTLRELSEELTSTENKVAFSRQLFNDATLDYNNAAQQFPTSVLAGLFGFREAAMLQATTNDAERAAVKVQF